MTITDAPRTTLPTTTAISLRGVSKAFGHGGNAVVALDNINLDVARGEFVCLAGASGCGKSTSLNLIAGLDRPTIGEVTVHGRTALMFQEAALFPWLTVRENVMYGPRRKKLAKDDATEVADRFIEAVGLTRFAGRYPWQLSGGMQQRVAIARALAYRPKLLLMDEPFASVDAQTREGLEDLVLQIRDTYDMTILFVTHDIDESVYLANRVLVLSRPPARLVEDIRVDLPEPRDQITTRENPDFVHLRGHVARLIHGGDSGS